MACPTQTVLISKKIMQPARNCLVQFNKLVGQEGPPKSNIRRPLRVTEQGSERSHSASRRITTPDGGRGQRQRECRWQLEHMPWQAHLDSMRGASFALRVEKSQEEYMTKKALLTAAILVSFAAPALAEEYYVVRGPDRHCTVTTTKPTEQTTITQIGPLAFESREKAEDRIKTTTVCSEGATTGSSTTTIERK
jgi:hypothetical protein